MIIKLKLNKSVNIFQSPILAAHDELLPCHCSGAWSQGLLSGADRTALHCGCYHTQLFFWTTGAIVCEVILAVLSAVALGLAFSALQWNKTKELLIPAAVMAPVVILASLGDCVFVLLVQFTSTNETLYNYYNCASQSDTAEAILTALLYLIESVLTAYYWAGLINLYGLKRSAMSSSKPSTPPSPTLQPAPFYHSGDHDLSLLETESAFSITLPGPPLGSAGSFNPNVYTNISSI